MIEIKAEAHTDDRAVKIEFDAVSWFAQAEDSAIVRLAGCQWGGDYPADEIADFYSGTTTAPLFEYIAFRQKHDLRPSIGFECYINESDALAWLETNRPLVFSLLYETEGG